MSRYFDVGDETLREPSERRRAVSADAAGDAARLRGRGRARHPFVSAMVGMLGLIAALYVVASVLRLSGEETSGRAEPVLAGAVGGLRWAAGHLVVAFGGAALVMLLAGLGFAAGYGQDAGALLGACLVQLPAVRVIGGAAVLLYGVLPRGAVAAWGVAGTVLLYGWIGSALDLPQAVLDASPFGHLPKFPGGERSWSPVPVLLLLLAATLVAVGLAGPRRRDPTT